MKKPWFSESGKELDADLRSLARPFASKMYRPENPSKPLEWTITAPFSLPFCGWDFSIAAGFEMGVQHVYNDISAT